MRLTRSCFRPGALPAGLTISSGGVISGTPTASGSPTFQIQATDPGSNTGFRTYTLDVGTPSSLGINPATLPDGFLGTAYSQTLTVTGGTGPYTFSITSGALPNGLTLSSAGVISGTPTTGGPFTFTVGVDDSAGNTGSRTYTVNIGTNSLTVNPASLPNGMQGTAYSQTVTASGGTGPYTFVLSSGALPAGLSLSSGGVLSGTPTGSGPSTFTVRATDSVANTGSRTYTITIGSNILTVSPASLPAGTQGVAYSQTITASGGTAPYTFARTSGALPTGLTLTSGGVLSGTPTASGTFNFDVTATDTSLNTGTRSYSVTINLVPLTINPTSLPAGTVGTAYSQTVVASGGTGPYTYTVSAGTIPTGLTLGSGGTITGTPSAAGAFTFTVQATDAVSTTGTRSYTVNIGGNILTVAPATLPNGTQGTPYSQTVTASGGTGPYTFVLTSGALPAGLTLSAGGVISGTPTGSGTSNFTIGATDSVGNTGSHAYSVVIGTVSLTVAPASLPAGTQGTPYSQTVTASGGTGPYTFALTSGALPTGLRSAARGVISGTPTASGAFSFRVQAVDSLGNAGLRDYVINIGIVSLTVNPATLPATLLGHSYSQTVSATGGTAPYTFAISAGALPPGLTLNPASGVISGTPTTPGTATFTVQATDINGNIGTRAYTLTNRPDPALDPDVQGLILAQVSTAQRFASTQIDNIARHLESLHDHFNGCSVNFGIAPPIDPANQQSGAPYGYPLYGGQAPIVSKDPWGPAYVMPPGQRPRPMPGAPDCATDWASSMALWTSGSFQIGSVTPNGASSGNRFTTAGITAGVDFRATDNVIVGLALGYGANRSDIGQSGTRSDAASYSATLYASLRLFEPLFLDAALGYGSLGYNNSRWIASDGTAVQGTRNGSYWFGTLEGSLELSRGRVKFAPYARADFITATLNGYAENGASALLLTYDALKFNATSGAIGLRGSIDIPMSYGTLSPTARFEYKQTSQSAFDQSMYYTDLGAGSSSTFSQPAGVYGTTTGALGLRVRAVGGLAAELEYGISGGTAGLRAQSLRGSLRMPF